MSFGEELRQAREQRGASLADVEKETKIRAKYIKAMENDDFDVLPGKVYVRGFLRMYARFLGLDGDFLVERYEEQLAPWSVETEEPEAHQSTALQTEKTTLPWKPLLMAAVVIILVFVVYQGGTSFLSQSTNNGNDKNPDTSLEQENGQNSQSATSNTNDPANEYLDRVDVVLHVTDGISWMHVEVDNETVFEGNVGPNNIKQFTGQDSISLKLGNAGVVKVQVNGKDYGFLDSPGQVIDKTFTANDDNPDFETTGG